MSNVRLSAFRIPVLIVFMGFTLGQSPLLHAENTTAFAPDFQYATPAPAVAPDDADDSQSSPECTINYYRGDAPNFVNLKLATNTTELCFDGFTVMYSGITRTPLWSAEHLTRERINNAETLSRLNNFHEENQLPFEIRSTLADYKGSGFDRGHLQYPPKSILTSLNQIVKLSL